MIISHKFKFIFIKNARTASTSIETFLSPICGPDDVVTPFSVPERGHQPRNYKKCFNPIPEIIKELTMKGEGPGWRGAIRDLMKRRKFYHHIPGWIIKERLPQAMWEDYFKFCVVRHPLEKIISGWHWYQKKYGVTISMDGYLDFCASRISARSHGVGVCPFNLYNYIDPKDGSILVDRFIRYENLNEELQLIFNKLGVSFCSPLSIYAKKITCNEGIKYHEFFTQRQRDTIKKLFTREFEMHGYPMLF